MSTNSILNVFIAGAGQMGQGIAQVVACSGLNVILYDLHESSLKTAVEKIKWSLEKLHAKGQISESVETVLARIVTTSELASAAGVDLVLEAAPENELLKQELFQKLDEI